jgi:hypothetical protein
MILLMDSDYIERITSSKCVRLKVYLEIPEQ